jgi:hypothetical protein
MTDIGTAVESYFAMWNEEDASRRASHIAQAWEDGGHYVDPLQEAKGADELSQMVTGVQDQFPGHRFRKTSGIDQHHGLVRFGWELVAPDGGVTVAGLDIGVVSETGKLQRIAGFFGDLPQA